MTGRWGWTNPLAAIAGFVLWALYFVAIYSVFSIGCELQQRSAEPGAPDRLGTILILTSLPFVGLQLWLTLASLRGWRRSRVESSPGAPGAERERFYAMTAFWLNLLALAATLWVGLPLVLTAPC